MTSKNASQVSVEVYKLPIKFLQRCYQTVLTELKFQPSRWQGCEHGCGGGSDLQVTLTRYSMWRIRPCDGLSPQTLAIIQMALMSI